MSTWSASLTSYSPNGDISDSRECWLLQGDLLFTDEDCCLLLVEIQPTQWVLGLLRHTCLPLLDMTMSM